MTERWNLQNKNTSALLVLQNNTDEQLLTIFFHFILLFWYHVFTCSWLRPKDSARSILLWTSRANIRISKCFYWGYLILRESWLRWLISVVGLARSFLRELTCQGWTDTSASRSVSPGPSVAAPWTLCGSGGPSCSSFLHRFRALISREGVNPAADDEKPRRPAAPETRRGAGPREWSTASCSAGTLGTLAGSFGPLLTLEGPKREPEED